MTQDRKQELEIYAATLRTLDNHDLKSEHLRVHAELEPDQELVALIDSEIARRNNFSGGPKG